MTRWRRGWDSNPRDPLGVCALSRGVPSTTRPPLLPARLKPGLPPEGKREGLWVVQEARRRPDCGRLRPLLKDAGLAGMRMGWVRAAVAVIPLTLILLISVPPDFILGRGPYWDYLISDRAQAVTGYLYFVQNSWAQPLLFIPNLSIPQGDYLINADSIVLLALIGRAIHSLLGAIVIPYGVWYVLCGVLNGVAGVVILRRTGVADFGRLAAAAVLVGSAAFWLERWYQISLIAQFLILLAVHAYMVARVRPWPGLAYGLALATVASLDHIYLFFM